MACGVDSGVCEQCAVPPARAGTVLVSCCFQGAFQSGVCEEMRGRKDGLQRQSMGQRQRDQGREREIWGRKAGGVKAGWFSGGLF